MSDNDLPQSEISYEDLPKYGRYAWMMRPCDWYKQEYKDCKCFSARIQQYFVYGQPIDCSDWQNDYQNCMQFRKTKRNEFLERVIASELDRKRKRLQTTIENNIWTYRTEPPKDWQKPLPNWLNDQIKDSFLARESNRRKEQTKSEDKDK